MKQTILTAVITGVITAMAMTIAIGAMELKRTRKELEELRQEASTKKEDIRQEDAQVNQVFNLEVTGKGGKKK